MNSIEFLEDTHQYLVGGVLTPSVTQLVRSVVNEDYSSVPRSVLNKKAEYGNQMHEWIERYVVDGVFDDSYLTATQKLSIDSVVDAIGDIHFDADKAVSEVVVAYGDLYAGKFDLMMQGFDLGMVEHNMLIDIKTTAKLNVPYLEWQLGLYALAIRETLEVELTDYACLWVPKRKAAKLVEIMPKSEDECTELALWYREQQEDEEQPSWLIL